MGRLIRLFENRSLIIFSAVILVLSGIAFGIGYNASKHAESSASKACTDRLLVAAGRLQEAVSQLSQKEISDILLKDGTPEEARRGEDSLGTYGFKTGTGRGMEKIRETSILPALTACLAVIVCGIAAMVFMAVYLRNARTVARSAEKKIRCRKQFSDLDFILLNEAVNALTDEYKSTCDKLSDEKKYLADYLQDFSHQVKTPAAGLTLNNEIYRTHALPPEDMAEYLERDRVCIERITKLCAESLKLARLEAGAVKYDMKENSLAEVAERACAPLYELAAQDGTDLCVDIPTDLMLRCDELWFAEAVSNLVKNACEHSRGGSVTVTSHEDPMTVLLYITDDGEGIADEDIPHIFRRFYSKSSETDPASTGIGMAISKRITEAMGGRMYIDTAVGKGTTIKIEFLKSGGTGLK